MTEPNTSSAAPRKQIQTPDGTVLELVESIPADAGLRGARAKARKHALDILFEADLRGAGILERLTEHVVSGETVVRPYTSDLVRGIARDQRRIDRLVSQCLPAGWTLERMPRVDRCLARLAVHELLRGEPPAEVTLEQAVAMAAQLSTPDSAGFLNGLLAQARKRIEADEMPAEHHG